MAYFEMLFKKSSDIVNISYLLLNLFLKLS